MENIVHVYPQADLVEHDTDGEDCICGPRTEPVEREDGSYGWVIVHRAAVNISRDSWDYDGEDD